MFPPLILNHPVPVDARDVDGAAHVDLTVAEPDVLIRLSIALQRQDPTGDRAAWFRSLAGTGGWDRATARARELLAVPQVREALTLTFTPAAADVLAADITDAAETVFYGPDDEPRRGAEA